MKLKTLKENINFCNDLFKGKYNEPDLKNQDEVTKKAMEIALELAKNYLKDNLEIEGSISGNDITISNLNIKKEKTIMKEISIGKETEIYFITLKK